MTIVELLEAIRSSEVKRARFSRLIFVALTCLLLSRIVRFSDVREGRVVRTLTDFDAFYIAGQMVWRGEIEQAYRFATMARAQLAFSDDPKFLPWTYPPQFDLVVAPLALLPLGAAYAVFITTTLVAYLLVLKKLAGDSFALVLVLLFPAVAVTIGGGQNGFLTGALIGLTCLFIAKSPAMAGVPLGLMAIKPHLAVAFGVYTLISRRWSLAIVAGAVVLGTSALATLLLGPGVWTALLDGVKEARFFLEKGMYPLHRMVSPYAAVRSFGLPALAAAFVQGIIALWAIGLVVAVHRPLALRPSLGLTAIASLLISPYAYDYDLLIVGIGLALLLPDLIRLGTPRERGILYGLSFLTSGIGLAQSFRVEQQFGTLASLEDGARPATVAGLTLAAMLALSWRILQRERLAEP